MMRRAPVLMTAVKAAETAVVGNKATPPVSTPSQRAMPRIQVYHPDRLPRAFTPTADIKVTQFDNGVRVVTMDKGGPLARIELMTRMGPVWENRFTAGLSHFIGRSVDRMSLGSSEYVRKSGASTSGVLQPLSGPVSFYNKEWMAWTQEGPRDTMTDPILWEQLWTLPLFPRFENSLMKELKKHLQKESSFKSAHHIRYKVNELMHKASLSGPLANSIEIPEANLKSFLQEDCYKFWEEHTSLDNIMILGVNVDHDALAQHARECRWLERSYVKSVTREPPASKFSAKEASECHRRWTKYDDTLHNVVDGYTGIGYKSAGYTNPTDWAAAQVIKGAMEIAGPGGARRAMESTSGWSMDGVYRDCGFVGTVMVNALPLDGQRVAQAVLAASKWKEESDMYPGMSAACKRWGEEMGSLAGTLRLMAMHTPYGEVAEINEFLNCIRKVTVEDCRRVATEMLEAGPSLVVYGDSPNCVSMKDLQV